MEIHQTIVRFIDERKPFALAVILHAEGSTPARSGGKALIEPDGRIHGTIGGGKVEATAQKHAIEACRSKKACVFDFALAGADAASDMPVCGGKMRILIDPNAARNRPAYADAAQSLHNRQRGILLTKVVTAGSVEGVPPSAEVKGKARARCPRHTCIGDARVQIKWLKDGAPPPEPLTEQISACTRREQTEYIVDTAGGTETLIEPLIPHPMLIIVGGGHVGQALAIQARLVGFDITVLDDRSEFTDPGRFPQGTRTLRGDIPAILADAEIAPDIYVVIVTRGHQHDAEALKACIHSPAAYIGMIGSKRKVALLRADFVASGIAADRFDRVFAPVGLDIGAVTVPEIAASIVAQLVAVRRKGPDAAGRIRIQP
jgi:xanthine dehydrogenase accessory factor